MQKLVGRDTYTPWDAPLVPCNCDLPLNREETLSVSDLKTPSNNPEVDYSRRAEALKALSPHFLTVAIHPFPKGKGLFATKKDKRASAQIPPPAGPNPVVVAGASTLGGFACIAAAATVFPLMSPLAVFPVFFGGSIIIGAIFSKCK